MTIRQPTVFGISFKRVVDALQCQRVSGSGNAHATSGKTRSRAEAHSKTTVRCHARVERKAVVSWVRETRRGKTVLVPVRHTVRVVVLPHVVNVGIEHVGFGQAMTVSGWLGTPTGSSLPGQQVVVLAAPDNGQGDFRPVAVAHTAGDGSWSARVPPGPSRIVEAAYAGSTTAEPAASAQVRSVVTAKIEIEIRPRITHWGATVQIRGRVLGGYEPSAGELVFLWIGWPGGSAEIGHLYAGLDGRFYTPYTFLRGNGSETYEAWATTASESDYPFAPGRSRNVVLRVSSQ
jgi:hypothetical protein